MTKVTIKLLGEEVEATLKGTVWDQGEQYFIVSRSGSEYRVSRSDIIDKIPKTKRLDTEPKRGESDTARDGEKHIIGDLKCPNCFESIYYESSFEGTLQCESCNGEYDIRSWKSVTPNSHWKYEFR